MLSDAGHVLVNFRNGSRQWVDVQRLRHSRWLDDRELLGEVVAHELYGNDHAGGGRGGDPRRHGPYWRDRITSECFDRVSADAADGLLRRWAGSVVTLTWAQRAELEGAVYGPLRGADVVYALRDLGRDAFHDWGGVHTHFHEFVLVERPAGAVTLVVAADD